MIKRLVRLTKSFLEWAYLAALITASIASAGLIFGVLMRIAVFSAKLGFNGF